MEFGARRRAGCGVASAASAAGVGVGRGDIDPSKLHLKKELTQIQKAARVLRDPGTSRSWRSPSNSARSLPKHHHLRHPSNGRIDGNSAAPSSEQFLKVQSIINSINDNYNCNNIINHNYSGVNGAVDKGNVRVKEKEGRVYLYNWRGRKSGSERTNQIGEDDVENSLGEGSAESLGMESSRNGGGNDSKSDIHFSERYPSVMFKCQDVNLTSSVRHAVKKKSKRGNYSSAGLRHHSGKMQRNVMSSRWSKNGVEGLRGLGSRKDDSESLVDRSDDAGDYSNSEDLRRESPLSPFLASLRNKGLARSQLKLLRNHRKEDDSVSYSTPAMSTSSYNGYGVRNPSAVESWDTTTGSFNDADDEVDDQLDLPGQQGCGIACCWSRRSTPKSRGGYGSGCSPSLSDAIRRKGSAIFCGSHSAHRIRHHRLSLGSNKRRLSTKCHVPLLANSSNGGGGSSMDSENSEDELPPNFGELDLEALSRLDGRRWSSSCRSQEGLELVTTNGEPLEDSSPENARSLSYKYQPMLFQDLIGQNIVVQSLTNAISRGRIAPIYLFQGPRGTGKSSTARIFAAALNCLSTEEIRPCRVCRQCADFLSGKSRFLTEVDGSNRKGINNIKNLLKSLSVVHPSVLSQFMVFVVDECHLLPSKTWLTFLRLLEKPLPRAVFILITTDVDNVPRTILSRCQKHIFNKISNGDIVNRLKKIATDETLDVEPDALELIASNADGSMRDAETMIDQLSLFGKRITASLVNELIGVVSDEKLLGLLELAMSSNATETVIKARELLDSGADPIVLMSQMATLIVDIIAGSYPNVDGKHDSFFGGRNLSERELDRLKYALTLLSDAEKHLRVSSERATWFTATLLQLGSVPSSDQTHSGSSRRRQSSRATEEEPTVMLRDTTQKQTVNVQLVTEESGSRKSCSRSPQLNSTSKETSASRADAATPNSNLGRSQFMGGELVTISQNEGKGGRSALRCVNSEMLTDIWLQCIEKCHSKTLRQLLHSHGRLVLISETKGGFVAHISFGDRNIKMRAEGFLSSITNAFESVLRRNVEVKIILSLDCLGQKQPDGNIETNLEKSLCCESVAGNVGMTPSKEGKSGIPVKRIESIIREQRLETAWLQTTEKGTPGSANRLKPERNQVLPQDNTGPQSELESINSANVPSLHWEDELNREIRALKFTDGMAPQKDEISKRMDHYPISPSLLHNSSSFASNCSKENKGYESGAGALGCFCWNNARTPGRGKKKGKQGTHLRARKNGRFSWFRECAKAKRTDSRRLER